MASENTEISSFVSLLIISKQDSTHLLISDPISNEYWIPSIKLEKKLDSWNAAVNSLLSEFQKQTPVSKSHKILKLLKVWQPFPFLPLYHAVYKVEISLELKKKFTLKTFSGFHPGQIDAIVKRFDDCMHCRHLLPEYDDSAYSRRNVATLPLLDPGGNPRTFSTSISPGKPSFTDNTKRNMSWVTIEDLASPNIRDNLKSPEITHFIYLVNDKSVPFSLKPSPIINFPEGPWDNVMSGDVVFEIEEKHIVSESVKKDGVPVENIVDAAGITKQEQAALYREFLLHTFPCLFMSRRAFENFLSQFNGIIENVANLFRTADIYSRNALSFKDFIHIIAACESDSTGLAAEIRSRYLYRFFVKNNSGIMNYHEFLKLTEALLKARKAPLGEAQVKGEAEKIIKSIGLDVGGQVPIIAFLKGVGGLKIRGTSSLMRFSKSVTDAVKCKHAHKKTRKAEVETSDRKTVSGRGNYEKNERNFTSEIPYDLAIHCVRLNNEKLLLNDVQAFWAVKGAVSQSSTNIIANLQKLKQNDFNLYASSFLPNDILKALDYFVVENKDAGKKKEAFSWGKLDPIGFAKALMQLCDMAQEVFKQEPRMLEIGSPVYVIGDLYGNFSYFKKFENILWGMGPTFTPCSLLFLGNYVDQGPHGIELVAYLLSHKLRCPQQVWLIRGNHEIRDVQKKSTFFKECETKFGADLGNQLWQAINSAFDTLPLAAIIDDQLFCCHGGIPPKWLCSTVNAINKIPCPLQEPEGNKLAWELMWNDPIRLADLTEDRSTELSANEGFAINFKRGTAHLFDSTALEKFLFVNGFTKVIRAHEFCKSGYQIQHKGKLLTVCSNPGGNTNEGAVALCFNQKIRFFCYE